MQNSLVLILILILGYLGHNPLVTIAAGVLLLVQMAGLTSFLSFFGQYGVPAGIVLMVVGVLVPFATGHLGLTDVKESLTSLSGILSVVAGAFAAYLSGKGVILLNVQPEIIVGLIFGVLLGIFLFRGVPVGPLVAAGLAALLIGLSKTLH